MAAEDYNPLDAAAVAYRQLPTAFRARLMPDDVLRILYLEFQFHTRFTSHHPALHSEIEVHDEPGNRMERMISFIYEHAASQGVRYTVEEIAQVLKGEDVYLRQIGVITS